MRTTASACCTCRSIAGSHELGSLGAWGEWNVGNWVDDVQRAWIAQDL